MTQATALTQGQEKGREGNRSLNTRRQGRLLTLSGTAHNIPGKHEVMELQKTAILGTAHILQKVLM